MTQTKTMKGIPSLDMTIREIIERWPATGVVLAARGLDLCCGGIHPLRMATQAHGLDPQPILDEVVKAAKTDAR